MAGLPIATLLIAGSLLFTFVLVRLGQGRAATTDGQGVRFGGFNALRALAALGVVAGHSLITASPLPQLPRFVVENMATGVALFFVISGFLLYRPFAASLVRPDKVSVRSFAANRVLRIVPLYVVVVLVVYLASPAAYSPADLAHSLTFTGVYLGHDLIPVAWSLDDEVAFYLLLPVLFVALVAWPRPGQRLGLGAAVIGVLCATSLVALARSPGDQAIIGGPVAKFHQFGLGMLLATLHVSRPRYTIGPTALAGVAAAVAALLSISGVAYEAGSYFFSPVCGLAHFFLVGLVVFSPPASRLTRALSWGPIVHLGDISYGIYLWHEPLHHVLFNLKVLSADYLPGFLELACATIALATGTYFLVEKPALRIKRNWARASNSPRAQLAQPKETPTGSIYT